MELMILQLGIIVVSLIILLTLVWTYTANQRKKTVYNNLPRASHSWIDRLSANKNVKEYLEYLTTGNGMNDSIDEFFKDCVKMSLSGACLIVIASFVGYAWIGILIAIYCLAIPVVNRISRKKEYKKKYIASFYRFLNYIILYISGGVPMGKAIVEVEKLIPEDDILKGKLKQVIIKNNISGLSGNTYIDALYELNRDLDYPEINLFINSAKRSLDKGDEISENLIGQLDDIFKKVELDKRAIIARQETKFTVFQVCFNMMPTLLIFAGPIFIASIMSLNIF